MEPARQHAITGIPEADRFFSDLTGVHISRVEEVSPERGEMEKEGAEYMLALRGDPVSGASLLSTTIQTTMLMRRLLDRYTSDDETNDISDGLYGKKVFAFADDLDVINRMFHNLRDAEGQSSDGSPDYARHSGGSLANLRGATQNAQNEEDVQRYVHKEDTQKEDATKAKEEAKDQDQGVQGPGPTT